MNPVVEWIIQESKKETSVVSVRLFGSRARGDSRERSDYDFCFEFLPGFDSATFFLNLMELSPTLCGLDLVDWDQASEKLRTAVLKEGKVVYESKRD